MIGSGSTWRKAALAVLVTAPLAGVTAEPAAPPPREPPNIVLILADDMREDDLAYMPEAQRLLADVGTTFSNYYTTYPICCPSRATTLTGMYVHNHHVDAGALWPGFVAEGHEEDSLAPVLDAAGYTTGLFGKYLNGYNDATHVPPGWDKWRATLVDDLKGADYYEYDLSDNGVPQHFGRAPADYQTDVLGTETVSFLETTTGPLFAYVSVPAPHRPWVPAPRDVGVYDDRRLETLLSVDDLIARIVQTLRKSGKLENTYIFFASDNGWMLGEHGVNAGKSLYWEESASVQLVVRGPDVDAGVVRTELTGNHDLGPTFAALASTALPHPDGRSLLPLLGGQGQWTRQQLYLQNPDPDRGRGPWRAVVRDDGYKLVKKAGPDSVFDLSVDPGEQTDIRADMPVPVRDELYTALDALAACAGPTCAAAEDSEPTPAQRAPQMPAAVTTE